MGTLQDYAHCVLIKCSAEYLWWNHLQQQVNLKYCPHDPSQATNWDEELRSLVSLQVPRDLCNRDSVSQRVFFGRLVLL